MSSPRERAHQPSSFQLASFPPEILGEIFLASIPVIGNRDNLPAYFPFTLTHVCRHWRASALAFPKLWLFIDVEQTAENQEGDCPEHELMEEYLERSGNHPLTIRLAHSFDRMHYTTYMETLYQYSDRWETVFFRHLCDYAFECLFPAEPSSYPMLRNLDCSLTYFDSDPSARRTLGPIPWAQLKRYHEYACYWSPNGDYQWAVLKQLVNVVDLRMELSVPYTTSTVKMPQLRFAYIYPDIDINRILDSFEFPRIEGLSLKLLPAHPSNLLLPTQFKRLKILRLCGEVVILNTSLLVILTELTTLTDLAVQIHGDYSLSAPSGIDALYLFKLLTPDHDAQSVLVPQLQALRLTGFNPRPGAVDALIAMLRRRFGGSNRVQFSRLRRFELWMRPLNWFDDHPQPPTQTRPPALGAALETLQSLRVTEGWDIRVDEEWAGDFWKEEMTSEFL
ncbi:hypothetical protein B0H16DRAFT_1882705 [Mycena metata]|uniref:F-box domain-containing protein n=1 Tax=Mycena metata TaxID=1033252 RepID=A0AAD7JK94_9AGAR|nr:hypothetical protein B0H16DRAFT_1882705 [Mycena metata]